MRDTQKNIKNYKNQIVYIKEKLATALLLFVVSSVMLVTSTFAWFVLSTSPEVTGITTTIAGNGNLEIALASSSESGTLLSPASSQVGDSNLPLVQKNITWGNLVNLADPSYGLNNIVLRPATINNRNLTENPLRAVKYSEDGRIDYELYEFAYSNFDPEANNGEGNFVIEDTYNYGVRAISSVTYTDLNEAADRAKIAAVRLILEDGIDQYEFLVSKDNPAGYIDTICLMIGDYLTNRFDSSKNVNFSTYMKPLRDMMVDFVKCIDAVGLTYVEIANVQVEKIDEEVLDYYSWEDLQEDTSPTYNGTEILYMDGLDNLLTAKAQSNAYIAEINNYLTNTPNQHVAWADIEELVNFMVDIESCVINEGTVWEKRVDQIGKQVAIDLLTNSGIETHTGTIKKGALKDFELIIGNTMYVTDVTIKASYSIFTVPLNADVYTDAPEEGSLDVSIANLAKTISTSNANSKVAGNVYGMAIDFFLRTNADNTYVVLEGQPIYRLDVKKTTDQLILYKDKEGNEYYHEPDTNYPAPKNPDAGVGIEDREYLYHGIIYSNDNGQEKSYLDPKTGEYSETIKDNFIQSLEYSTNAVVVGYDGENRVWQEGIENPDASTTQGNGSCYVFYPQDRLELEQMLELLDALMVTFIDIDGEVLAHAGLNIKDAFEEPGKVTVPLEIIDGGVTYFDNHGDSNVAITELARNEATYITAIVYIDGTKLSNKDVNANTNITGYLNLQFGSSDPLVNMDDEELKYEEVYIDATANVTSFEYVKGQDAVSDILLTVTGLNPGNISGTFVRQISSFQGVMSDEKIVFTNNLDGTWSGQAKFTRPGTYVLRSVWLDGIEYELREPISIVVKGFDITNLTWTEKKANTYIMTEKRTHTTSVTVTYAGAYEPQSMVGKFRNEEDNSYVNVNLVKTDTSNEWEGTALFEASGTYVLDTVIVDNEVHDVSAFKKTLTLFLGITVDVELSGTYFLYQGSPIDVGVSVTIKDNTGSIMPNLNNTSIRYGSTNTNIPTLDSPLEWNEITETYVGEFHIENASIYSFDYLEIDRNEISTATSSKITVIPPEPPVYVPNATLTSRYLYQFAPNDDAFMQLQIDNSSSATIAAVMTNSDTGATEIVEGTNSNSTWKFVIPNEDKTYSQNGTWTIEKLYLTDVYVDGLLYTKGNSEDWSDENDETQNHITWLMSELEETPVTATVLNDIKVIVNKGDKYSKLVKDENNKDAKVEEFIGSFTDSLEGNFYIPNYSISYTDMFGNSLDNTIWNKHITISDTNLTYTHLKDTLPEWWTNSADIYGSSNKVVSPDTNNIITYLYAGTYTPKLELTINDVVLNTPYQYSVTLSNEGETIVTQQTGSDYNPLSKENVTFVENVIVEWNQPDAMFTALNPNGEHFVTTNRSTVTGTKTNRILENGILAEKGHQIEVWVNATANSVHEHTETCLTCAISTVHTCTYDCYANVTSTKHEGSGRYSQIKHYEDGTKGLISNGFVSREQTRTCIIVCGSWKDSNNYYMYFNGEWYKINGTATEGETLEVTECPDSHKHSIENGCYQCKATDSNYYNTHYYLESVPTKATVQLLNGGKFESAKLQVISSKSYLTWNGTVYTHVDFSFSNETGLSPATNVGIVDNGGLNAGNYPTVGQTVNNVYQGARATYVSITYSGKVYTFTLENPLIINEAEGSADAYY